MKVTEIKTFFVDPGVTVEPGDTKNWLLIKIETDEGISGWGECHTLLDRERSIAAYVGHIGNYLVAETHSISSILQRLCMKIMLTDKDPWTILVLLAV